MPNLNYKRSRSREYDVLHSYEDKGYYAVRAAGSHGLADIIAIKPVLDCGDATHFEVVFIQIKVSQNLAHAHVDYKTEMAGKFPVNVMYYKFPVKSKSWLAERRRVNMAKKKKGSKKGKK